MRYTCTKCDYSSTKQTAAMNHIRNIEDDGHQIAAHEDNNLVEEYRNTSGDEIESTGSDEPIEITELEDAEPTENVPETVELRNLEDTHVDKLAGNMSRSRDKVMQLLKNAVESGYSEVNLETGEVLE